MPKHIENIVKNPTLHFVIFNAFSKILKTSLKTKKKEKNKTLFFLLLIKNIFIYFFILFYLLLFYFIAYHLALLTKMHRIFLSNANDYAVALQTQCECIADALRPHKKNYANA